MPAATPQPEPASIDQDARGRYRVRVRVGQRGRHRIVLGALGKVAAERRATLVVELARHLHDRHDALNLLREAAAPTTSEAMLLAAIAAAKKSAARPDHKVETFRTVGEAWASGDLAKRYPDSVQARRTSVRAELDRLCAVIGEVPIAKFSLADACSVSRSSRLAYGFCPELIWGPADGRAGPSP